MKKLVSSIVLCSTLALPIFAFAQEEATASDEQTQEMMSSPEMQRPHPFAWTCAARDFFGFTYYARSWNRNAAAQGAMNNCRWSQRGPVSFCRFLGCSHY